MPLVSAGLSILARGSQLPRDVGDGVRSFFPGALSSDTWVIDFLVLMRGRRPPAPDSLPGVAIGCFDNLSSQ